MVNVHIIVTILLCLCIKTALSSGDWEYEAVMHVDDASEVFTLNFAKVSHISH
jgi:hypothetical protein